MELKIKITDETKYEFFLELMQELGYVEVVDVEEDTNKEDLPEELKEFLKQRLENYKKSPEKVKTWDEIERNLLKKYDYEV